MGMKDWLYVAIRFCRRKWKYFVYPSIFFGLVGWVFGFNLGVYLRYKELSQEPNVETTLIEENLAWDNEVHREKSGYDFFYRPYTHTVHGMDVGPPRIPSNPSQADRDERYMILRGRYHSDSWAHEFKHAYNSKYINVIHYTKNRWKARFLDEVSAYLCGTLSFRQRRMWDHVDWLETFYQSDGLPPHWNVFQEEFGSSDSAELIMDRWWSKYRTRKEMVATVTPEEATQLLFSNLTWFTHLFDTSQEDGYRKAHNSVFHYHYDYPWHENIFRRYLPFLGWSNSGVWFRKAVNAMFTYEINGVEMNLFELMPEENQKEFLDIVERKYEAERSLWLAEKEGRRD